MSPKVCPPVPDCPLYAQRPLCDQDEVLRRAILRERRQFVPGLVELVQAEAQAAGHQPPALPPPAPAISLPILDHLKEHSK